MGVFCQKKSTFLSERCICCNIINISMKIYSNMSSLWVELKTLTKLMIENYLGDKNSLNFFKGTKYKIWDFYWDQPFLNLTEVKQG